MDRVKPISKIDFILDDLNSDAEDLKTKMKK
jgi:hypothetical protein